MVETAEITEGSLRVWWIPQVPDEAFRVPVKDIEEAKKLLDILAKYDLWQLAHNIKPDYSNAGGLEVFENGEWITWYNELDKDIDDIMREEARIE